jgi:UPF0716 protein FxsA
MHPSVVFLLVFILVPLLEIGLFIEIGGYLGALPTIGLVILTAVLGVTLLRLQGFITLTRVRQKLDRGELPALDLAEGLILLIAAVLLLTPGFFTDLIGFLSLVPVLRRRVAIRLLKFLISHRRRPPGSGSGNGDIIEGEVVEPGDDQSRTRRLKPRDHENYN